MKRIEDKSRRFPYRLWFKDEEIDHLMEYHWKKFSEKIKQIDGPPMPIELFVEKYLKVELDYADLPKVDGLDVLGATYFYEHKPPEINIDKRLAEAADSGKDIGRYNFTLSHESFHALFHKELFYVDANQLRLLSSNQLSRIECLKRDIDGYLARGGVSATNTPWWEFQANVGGGALLMPKTMFLEHFNMERNAYGIKDNLKLVRDKHILKLVIGYLAQTFNASKLAVKVRLTQLECLPDKYQISVFQTGEMLNIREILRGMT